MTHLAGYLSDPETAPFKIWNFPKLMSVSVNDFWNRISDSGLADSNQCRTWAVEYVQGHGGPPTSAKALAKWLIDSGQLTVFQAQALLGGSDQPLVVGNYTLREPFDKAPLKSWFVAIDRANPTGPTLLLRLVDQNQQETFKLGWFRRHAKAESPHLQTITQVPTTGGEIAFVSNLPPGQRLSKLTTKGPLAASAVCKIGKQLGAALQVLHEAKAVHGCVHPSRVWITKDGDAILLRNPISKPTSPLETLASDCMDPLDSNLPLTAYAAPDFSIPGKLPDASTDLYALGCLLYQIRFGELPFQADKADRLIQLHSTTVPPGFKSLQGGDRADSLLRVIAHLMAKNRTARIGTARDLASIFDAVAKTPTTAPVSPAAKSPSVNKTAEKVVSSSPDRSQSLVEPKTESGTSAEPSKTQPPPTAEASPAQSPKPAAARPKRSEVDANPKSKPSPSKPVPPKRESAPPESKPSAKEAAPDKRDKVPSTPAPTKSAKPQDAKAPVGPPNREPSPPPPPSEPSPSTQPTPPAANPNVSASTPAPQTLAGAQDGSMGDESGNEARRKRRRPVSVKKKKKKKKQAALVIGGVGFSALMLLTAVLILLNRDPNPAEPERVPTIASSPGNAATTTNNNASVQPTPRTRQEGTDSAGGKFSLIDDRYALWLPPDESDPADLKMLPPGPQMIVAFRPSEIFNSAEGRKLMASIEPEVAGGIQQLENRIGVSMGQVERLILAVRTGALSRLDVGISVELLDLMPLGELKEKWGNPGASPLGEGQTIFAGDAANADAYYVAQQPPNDSMTIKRFAVGSIPIIKDVAELKGEAITLPRQSEKMWSATRGDAHFTVMLLPNFLFADGRKMLEDYAPSFLEPLRNVLIPKAQVAALSMNFDSKWYGEIRITPGSGATAPTVVQMLKQEFSDLQDNAESFLVGTTPHASWRRMAIKLPRMFEALASQVRTGISEDHATANFYLPGAAAYNVVPATLLAMNTPAGAFDTVAVSNVPSAGSAKPWTIDEMLEKELSVSFEQEPLHFAGTTVVDEINEIRPKGSPQLKVVIIGNDLQKMGITQNQQIRDFKADKVKLRDVLTQLVQRANIKKGLTDPKDPEQVLVWLVGPNPDAASENAIIITTRDGAKAANYTLPSEF